jgi:hypothetical protein
VAFKKELWWGLFSGWQFPPFPCPHCKTGQLQILKDTFEERDSQRSANLNPDEMPEDFIERQFVCLAKCHDQHCGEVVSVAGHFSYEEAEVEVAGSVYPGSLELVKNIDFISPAPPMIDLPEETPREVSTRIKKSFPLYWVDRAACANRIRSTGEAILDSLTVPKTKRLKAQPATAHAPAKPAKIIHLDFNGRIQWLEKRNKKNAKIVDALRRVGNLGSHGDDVDKDTIHGAMKGVRRSVSKT